MVQPTNEQRRLAAYHEAARAVLRYHGGEGRLGRVSIMGDESRLREEAPASSRPEDTLRFYLGGMVAKARIGKGFTAEQLVEASRRTNDTGPIPAERALELLTKALTDVLVDTRVTARDLHDLSVFLLIIRGSRAREFLFPGMDEAAAIRHCWKDTETYIEGYWPAIEALAQVLISEQTISGERVHALIEATIKE